jgi:formamidopyrimidine-DNA glycosylase
MPELPEVQTVVDSLKPYVLDKEIIEVEVLNEKLIANEDKKTLTEVVAGSKIEEVTRRGKYIVIKLSNGYYLVTHLRMTGRFSYLEDKEELDKYDYIIFSFQEGDELRLGSKRKFTRLYLVTELEDAGGLGKLGPEPLSSQFTLAKFKELIAPRRGNIKLLLLNQKFLAGVGNIYADEILFRARVHPQRKADTLTEPEIEALYHEIREVLKEGIKFRGTTKWDYEDASGEGGSYQNQLQIYDRAGEECFKCETEVEKIKVGGRATYFCPQCQEEE